MESFVLEKALQIIKSNLNPALPSHPSNHVPQCNIHKSFKYLQGCLLNHLPGQPVPMLYKPFSEQTVTNMQLKEWFEAVSSCPVTSDLGRDRYLPLYNLPSGGSSFSLPVSCPAPQLSSSGNRTPAVIYRQLQFCLKYWSKRQNPTAPFQYCKLEPNHVVKATPRTWLPWYKNIYAQNVVMSLSCFLYALTVVSRRQQKCLWTAEELSGIRAICNAGWLGGS